MVRAIGWFLKRSDGILYLDREKPLNVLHCNFRNMRTILDTDALIKITKSSLKELITSNISVYIAAHVQKESVEEGKVREFPDAILVEMNIEAGKVSVIKTKKKRHIEDIIQNLGLEGGEADSLRLFYQGRYDSIVSDDRKFLELISGIGIPFLTPGALIVYLYDVRKISLVEARKCMDKIKDMISDEEYAVTMEELE